MANKNCFKLILILLLLSIKINASDNNFLNNTSYYQLVNYKIDDKSFKYRFIDKLKNEKCNYSLLVANAVLVSLYYLQYNSKISVYGASDKNMVKQGFITYGIILNVSLISLRFIDD